MVGPQTRDRELSALVRRIRAARSAPTQLSALLDEYERKFGPDANEALLTIIGRDTQKAWQRIAKENKGNSIEDLIDILWGSFKEAGGEFTVKRTLNGAQIHCTKCPMADTYKSIGRQEWGLIFHCSTDPHIVQGFNNRIVFKISKRLMNGDDCCNHSYSLPG